jgi:hypothetical protein
MKSEWSVVVSINGEVWGTWTLPSKPMPDQEQRLHQTIRRAIKTSSFPDHKFHIDYIQNLECQSFEEMLEGVDDSIHNEFDQDFD